ncbi:hypothetical protein Ddye_012745 [Dipteronia dyeriana]|uniref:Uncharacterized protein n=1 Tax=Dipteronia dyeriana TaxID=168575 RepID=A0AAD9X4Z7_9ROSI|nr:hypothetical protein Ddye_012745 [Dipteronia dyeriana]
MILKDYLKVVVGSGERVKFWKEIKREAIPLKSSYPKIFALASRKEFPIKKFGKWLDENWRWEIALRRPLFDWEIYQWRSLQTFLDCAKVRSLCEDSFAWNLDLKGFFLGTRILIRRKSELFKELAIYAIIERIILGGNKIIIVSDPKVTVSWVNKEGFGSFIHVDDIYDICCKLRCMGDIIMVFNPRSLNSFVDMLAKRGSSQEGDTLEWSLA